MSLARAFTKRTRRTTEDDLAASIPRSCTVRYAPGTINRAKISLPTELLSTTNVHALNAPDIRKVSADSSSDSIHSGNGSDNDFSTIDKGFLTADNSSVEGLSPITPGTPAQDDLKDFFNSKPVAAQPFPLMPSAAPVVPQRAPSHSKKAHVELSRKRSVQRMSPPPTAIADKAPKVRTSADMFSPSLDSHPFGRELRQVHEVAEEFGAVVSSGLIEEEREMMAKGLCKFTVTDYLSEIAPLYGGIFENQLSLNPWI